MTKDNVVSKEGQVSVKMSVDAAQAAIDAIDYRINNADDGNDETGTNLEQAKQALITAIAKQDIIKGSGH